MAQYKDLFKSLNTMYAEGDKKEVLYYDGENGISREEMHTMVGDAKVMNCVVDSWARILNFGIRDDKERKRHKVFFSTGPSIILNDNRICDESKNMDERIRFFIEKVDDELKVYKIRDLKEINMLYFPILNYEHFYLMCVNMNEATISIVDNLKLPKHISVKAKYGDQPMALLKALSELYCEKGYSNAENLCKFDIKFIKMPWRTTNDGVNCGIYLMHHMETYNGEAKDWDCFFKTDNIVCL